MIIKFIDMITRFLDKWEHMKIYYSALMYFKRKDYKNAAWKFQVFWDLEPKNTEAPKYIEKISQIPELIEKNKKLLKDVNDLMDKKKYRDAMYKLKDFIAIDNEECNQELSTIRKKFLDANFSNEEWHGFQWRLTCLTRENPKNPEFFLMKKEYFKAFTKTETYKKNFETKYILEDYYFVEAERNYVKLRYTKEEYTQCHYEYILWLKKLGYYNIALRDINKLIIRGLSNDNILTLQQELEKEQLAKQTIADTSKKITNLAEQKIKSTPKSSNKKINLQSCTEEDLLTIDGFDLSKATKFLKERMNGKVYYDLETFVEDYNLMPHQMINIQDRLIFTPKPKNKVGRKIDW